MEDGNHFNRLLDEQFMFLFAKAVQNNIESVSRKLCRGCEVGHPSQIQHSCIMYDTEEKLITHFSDIVDSINSETIVQQWCEAIQKLPVPVEYAEMFKVKYICRDWMNIEVSSEQFRDKLFDFTLKLVKLESRF